MKEHRVETIVSGDGSIMLRDVPFDQGEEVEVIVLPRKPDSESRVDRDVLRGSVRRFDEPFESAVDDHNWNAV